MQPAATASAPPWPADRIAVRDFDQLQELPDPVVAWESSYSAGLRGEFHHHHRTQLLLAVSTPSSVEVPDRRWSLQPGQAAWLPGGMDHSVSALTAPRFRSLYLRADLAAQLRPGPGLLQVSGLLAELIRRLADIYAGRESAAAYPHVVALVLQEIGHDGRADPAPPLPGNPRIRPLCEALLAEPGDRRTLADWARDLGTSARTLERLFRRETGQGFDGWRRQCRLHLATGLLRQGWPIQRVAWQVGYDSPSAFAAAYRRGTGQRPRDLTGAGQQSMTRSPSGIA